MASPITAFLFPGQGAQFVGMGRALCEEFPAAVELFQQASNVLDYDLKELCFNGPEEKLNRTEFCQPALYVTSLAAVERLRIESPELVESCSIAAGLSLGEYTALAFAGVLEFDDGLRLVSQRGRAMQAAAEASGGGMVSVLGLDREKVEQICIEVRGEQTLQVANLLCPGNIVVSGHLSACERVTAAAEQSGATRAIPLAVAGAFHTPLMQPAVEQLKSALDDVTWRQTRIPVVCNVDAQPHEQADSFSALLLDQLIRPVLWENSMNWMLDDFGVTQFYEIGAGRVLKGLLRRIQRKVACENVAI